MHGCCFVANLMLRYFQCIAKLSVMFIRFGFVEAVYSRTYYSNDLILHVEQVVAFLC